ncbi:MAG: hypothetical protein AAGU32_16380 [Bacillota bacterium]
MKAKTRILFIVGLLVFILGFTMLLIPIVAPFSGHTIIPMIFGMLLIIAGVAVFVRYAIQLIKERREFMMGRKPVTAAMVMQAQAEYNRRLAAYSKDGALADELTQAKLFAQAVLTLTLMAPSTAVFSDLNETAIAGSNGTYTVTGWVDAQNIFGAMMRSPFSISVFKKDGVWQTGPYLDLQRPL